MVKMRHIYIRILFIVVGVMMMALFAGCRSHRGLTENNNGRPGVSEPTVAEPEKPQLDTIRNASYSRYCANYSCTVDGVTVNGQIRIVHDSCIWISVNKIIEVGRILITPTRVSGYAKFFGKYFDGSFDELRNRWGIEIDYTTLEALLVGNCPPDLTRSKEPEHSGDDVTLWYSQKGKSQRKVTLHKDYVSKLLTATVLEVTIPKAQVRCGYSERVDVSGQMLPGVVDVSVSAGSLSKQTRLTLSRITLNKMQNTPFEIPRGMSKL